MYHKHLTEGIVVKSYDRGDSNKVLVLLTRDFGLIYATVQNARSEVSKLRHGVQDFTLGNSSLVKGRHSWKVVGAMPDKNIWYSASNKDRQMVLARALGLVSRVLGEEKNEEIFEIIKKFTNDFDEYLFLLLFFKNLGYVKEGESELSSLSKNKEMAIKIINKAMSESGMIK